MNTVVRVCIHNPNLTNSQLSLSTRVLLSIQLSLSQLSPSILSPYPQVFGKVQKKVNSICMEIASTSSISLQKTLPLIARECVKIGDPEVRMSTTSSALRLLTTWIAARVSGPPSAPPPTAHRETDTCDPIAFTLPSRGVGRRGAGTDGAQIRARRWLRTGRSKFGSTARPRCGDAR